MNSLTDYLISAPLSALLTVISGLSMTLVFDYAGRKIFKNDTAIFRAMYFFGGLLFVSWLIWAACLLQIANVIVFRYLLWSVISLAILLMLSKKSLAFLKQAEVSLLEIKRLGTFDFYVFCLLLPIFIGYALLGLTVPTDADSLSYHLAVPVEILKSGSLMLNKDNLHFRMSGFGEMLNLLGLSNGCPQMGSFIQIIGLFHILNASASIITQSQKLHLITLYLCIPTLLFLIPNQKHQLTGILATSACFLFLMQPVVLTFATLTLYLSVLFFAVGIKYSFILSAGALILFLLLKTSREIGLSKLILHVALLGIVILSPQLIFKWYYFNDPVSPLLERFSLQGDSVIVKLHTYIKDYSESRYPFPINLIFVTSFGRIPTVIGISAIVPVLLLFYYRQFKQELITIIFLIVIILIFGQASSRFLLEPVFWSIPLFMTVYNDHKYFKYVIFTARLQLLIVFPLVLFGIYNLAPSILTNSLRNEVMLNSSNGYAESIWIDDVLPPHARIAIANRSRAFLPRPYLPWEYLLFSSMGNREEAAQLDQKLKHQYKTEYLILPRFGFNEIRNKYAGKIIAGPKTFYTATRNPLNRMKYEMIIYKMK